MEVTLEKSSEVRATTLVLVDGEEWGRFEAHWHGPQGNSYTLHDCLGKAVRDEETRQTLRVHGDFLTYRLVLKRPWHQPELTVEERMLMAADYAIMKTWLDDPVLRRARAHADERNRERQREAEREKERRRDVVVGEGIACQFFPTLGECYIDMDMRHKLAEKIADAIGKGRSQ